MQDSVKGKKMPIGAPADRKKIIGFLIFLSLFFVGATILTKFNPFEVLMNQSEFWRFIFVDFFPPALERPGPLLASIVETLAMAVSATGIATVLAFLLAMLGSSTICKVPLLPQAIRALASILRNIPALVWAFILSASFGIGTHVGMLALVITTVAFLVRAFIETLEEASEEAMEAIRATGAGILPTIFQSIFPAAIPGFISWFLYCIETNIRASTILGMVGAGGIGLIMMSYIKQFNYHEGSAVILVIAVIVILVNLLTNYLRKKVLV